MRKLLLITLTLFSGFLATSCGDDTPTQEKVMEKVKDTQNVMAPDTTRRDHTAVKDSIDNNEVLLPVGGE